MYITLINRAELPEYNSVLGTGRIRPVAAQNPPSLIILNCLLQSPSAEATSSLVTMANASKSSSAAMVDRTAETAKTNTTAPVCLIVALFREWFALCMHWASRMHKSFVMSVLWSILIDLQRLVIYSMMHTHRLQLTDFVVESVFCRVSVAFWLYLSITRRNTSTATFSCFN
jgi:hypothetical protein